MKVLHYGSKSDYQMIEDMIHHLPSAVKECRDLLQCDDYEDFVSTLTQVRYNVVIVTMNHARGMVGVIAARTHCPNLPVVWFSDDDGFGLQSYRLGCTYFGVLPITAEKMERAIERCELQLRVS